MKRREKKGEPASRIRVRKILLVDNAELVLDAWRRQCKRGGWTPVCATNGTDALALARRERPQLAVVGLCPPHESGCGLVANLKKLRPRPYIVLASALMTADDAMMGIRAGADDCHDKEAAIAALVDCIERAERKPTVPLPRDFDELQRRLIRRAIDDHRGNVSAAARALGVFRQSLYRSLHRLYPKGRLPIR